VLDEAAPAYDDERKCSVTDVDAGCLLSCPRPCDDLRPPALACQTQRITRMSAQLRMTPFASCYCRRACTICLTYSSHHSDTTMPSQADSQCPHNEDSTAARIPFNAETHKPTVRGYNVCILACH